MLQFGTTKLYPGKVGDEYYMTKGHFHTILDTSEVYYCLSGQGGMLMETPEGEVDWKEMKPGDALYVPGRWAHRSVNTGSEPLVMFFVYRGDAGHDYGTIETKGYRKLLVEKGVPENRGGAGRKARPAGQPQVGYFFLKEKVTKKNFSFALICPAYPSVPPGNEAIIILRRFLSCPC